MMMISFGAKSGTDGSQEEKAGWPSTKVEGLCQRGAGLKKLAK